jgi:rod shape-determining protein MreC
MAVTTIDGLVGIVSHVSTFTSTVQLVTDLDENTSKGMPVSATVLGKEMESFGIIEYDEQSGTLQMTKIDALDPMVVGDKVITSGLGNVFPKGIVIGTVESRQVGDFGLTHTAIIKPSVKFDHLREVFVVVVPEVDGP